MAPRVLDVQLGAEFGCGNVPEKTADLAARKNQHQNWDRVCLG